MTDRSYIELLSNRLKARGIVEHAGNQAMSNTQLADSGFSGRPIGDRYLPMSRLGRGRLGEIYDARDAAGRDVGVERHVALQRIDDRIVAEQRFVDELETGYALLRAGAHPNIVKTLDFFRDGKGYYLVMELLEGVSLRSVLDDAAPEALSLEETASIVRAVGDGLQYLHAKSMVHGDLRPANVFITFGYVVKLLDVAPLSPRLGVPYRVEDAAQGSRGRDVRDDVYELACLTYELLSGRHPFNANSPHEAHRAGVLATPLPHLTVRQWQAIARGLALRAEERTPSVAQFLSEFGISGTERLRASADGADAPRAEAHVVPLPAAAPAASTMPPVPVARHVEEPTRGPQALRAIPLGREPLRPRQRRKIGVRGPLLFVVLVGVGAWIVLNYDAVRTRIANVGAPAPQQSIPIAQAASEPNSGATRSQIDQAEPTPPAAALGNEAEAHAVPAVEPSSPAEAELPTETVERNVVAEVRDAPTPAAPASTERSERPIASTSSAAFRFTQPVVTIRENQVAAAVVIERSAASAPATIVWWTSDNTAVADEDYADLGQRTERFAADERSRSVFVPLVVDSVPERTESFYVYLGRYDAARSHLEALSSVRVDIHDDD